MSENPLTMPVGALLRPSDSIGPEDSLGLAANVLRAQFVDVLPVVSGFELVGVVTEAGLARAMALGHEPHEAVALVMERPDVTLRPYASGAEALRLLSEGGHTTIPVTDDAGRLLGVLSASDLYPKPLSTPRPPMIGGMATPFGVYLTTGSVRAGAKDWALVLTGMLLFSLIAVASLSASWFVGSLPASLISQERAVAIENLLGLALFLFFMRMIPLSGIHAAEHKVVHAVERGEELVPSIVKRMPRVHPRCGTNLAVAAGLFLGIAGSNILSPELRLILAAVATLALWRPLGYTMQRLVTTRPPSDKHIKMGIDAATELLEKYREARRTMPSFPQRIWCSGMLHVIAGSFIGYFIVNGILLLLGVKLQI